MSKVDEINAENSFIKLGFSKIWTKDGFFFYNSNNNKAVLFNLKKKEWSVYDFDTLEPRGYGDELLKSILLQEFELNWLTWKEYQGELSRI